MSTPGELRVEFLLRRLVLLAGDVRDALATGDWEGAVPAQEEFDEAFAALQRHAERSGGFGQEHAADLMRLAQVHAENERLAAALHRTAGTERRAVDNVHRINRAYSPLGQNHRPSPRYVDGSA